MSFYTPPGKRAIIKTIVDYRLFLREVKRLRKDRFHNRFYNL
jgi:hypothetical protein